MGKKKNKQGIAQHQGPQPVVQIPWKVIDNDPISHLLAPEVCSPSRYGNPQLSAHMDTTPARTPSHFSTTVNFVCCVLVSISCLRYGDC